MKQMKHYTKQDFHNPEQLTRQQVGAEYRLLLPEEQGRGCINRCELFIDGYLRWDEAFGVDREITYRVPLATPLPDGTVLSSNECCWGEVKPSDPRKVVYCCGPMSGIENYNFPAFYEACAKLEEQGYKAINPAALDAESGYPLVRLNQLTPPEFQEFLKGAAKRDLDAIQQCQAIALLPGWESSKGARAEKAVAEWLGLEVIYLPGAVQSDAVGAIGIAGQCGSIGDRGVSAPSGPDGYKLDMGDYIPITAPEWTGAINKLPAYAPDDPKGAAGALKAPMWLLPASAMSETAWVHKHGAAKYHPYNWRDTGVCATTYISAIMRHLDQWRDGEDIDTESGRSHIAHIAASCNILMDAAHCGKLNDDRSKAP